TANSELPERNFGVGGQAKSLILLEAVFGDFRKNRLPEPPSDFFNTIGRQRTVCFGTTCEILRHPVLAQASDRRRAHCFLHHRPLVGSAFFGPVLLWCATAAGAALIAGN
ncbi:MAG: hypothetical protein LH610_06350, partial [Sphingomonas bacterium]|nr:hypothetical protein [Sphingomonas bacterium]